MICTECSPTYGLAIEDGVSTGRCEPCPDNCLNCSSNSKVCTKCYSSNGLELDEETNLYKCSPCPDNCSICLYASACDVCLPDFGLQYENGNLTGKCAPCTPHCLYCYRNSSFCEPSNCENLYGSVLDGNGSKTGECGPCPDGCLYCSDNNASCDQCSPGYAKVYESDSNTYHCIKCQDGNCLDCGSDPSICEKCAEGYGQYNISTANGAIIGCKKCPNNCQRCSQGACSICDYGYGLVVNDPLRVGECDPCELHCSYCSFDSTSCSYCEQGYGIIYENDQSMNKCGPCKEHCQKCSMDARECETCFSGYYPTYENNTGECIACPENCAYCNEYNCTVCMPGYNFVKTLEGFVKCGVCADNCESCTEERCTKCILGYGFVVVDGVQTDVCERCKEGCNSCFDDSNNCSMCNINYGFHRENGQLTYECEPCKVKNCVSCETDSSICQRCVTTYGFLHENGVNTGECVRCTDNCVNCFDNYEICTACYNGYNNIDGKCIQASCVDNCNYCNLTDDTCKSCLSGFGFNEDRTQCIKCTASNCIHCYDYRYCVTCVSGYGPPLLTNGSIDTTQCVKCAVENCNYCRMNASQCMSCNDGYTQPDINDHSDTSVCVPCITDGCAYCNYNSSFCRKCKTGYVSPRINGVLNQSICAKCPDGCTECSPYDPNYCFNCSKGYGLGWENGVSDGKCHLCSDQNCSYCRGNYKVCEYCIDSYCFDRVESSPTFGLCMPCNDPSTCQVDGCRQCVYNDFNLCEICSNGYTLTEDKQCILTEVIITQSATQSAARTPSRSLPLQTGVPTSTPSLSPIPSPTPKPMNITTWEVDDSVVDENGNLNETAFNDQLSNKFNEIICDEETSKVVVVTSKDPIPFNKELNDNEYIKTSANSTINFNGGKLNLILPDEGEVTVQVEDTKNVNLSLNGEGNIKITVPEENVETTTAVSIATESEINGSVTLTVPPNVETVEIETVNFVGKATLSVAKETAENPDDPEQPVKPAVKLTVNQVKASEQSEAVLADVKIQKVLTVFQSAQISVNNVDVSSAAINYEIFNTQGLNKPIFTGNLEDPPINISLNSLSPVPPDEDSRYVLIDGTFEENKCREWAYSIYFGNSGYKYYLCEDSQPNGQSKGSTLERKRQALVLLVSDPNGEKPKDKGLNTAQISGIVIACIVVVAVLIVVIVFAVIKKKLKSNSSELEDSDAMDSSV